MHYHLKKHWSLTTGNILHLYSNLAKSNWREDCGVPSVAEPTRKRRFCHDEDENENEEEEVGARIDSLSLTINLGKIITPIALKVRSFQLFFFCFPNESE